MRWLVAFYVRAASGGAVMRTRLGRSQWCIVALLLALVTTAIWAQAPRQPANPKAPQSAVPAPQGASASAARQQQPIAPQAGQQPQAQQSQAQQPQAQQPQGQQAQGQQAQG